MRRARAFGIVLILLAGLLNFHIPHFLFQSRSTGGYAGDVLEVILLANVLGALVSAVGIHRNVRWAWLLGLFVVAVSVMLYLAQETVGLPRLPQTWLEPSRVFSLLVDVLFAGLAVHEVRRPRPLRKGA